MICSCTKPFTSVSFYCIFILWQENELMPFKNSGNSCLLRLRGINHLLSCLTIWIKLCQLQVHCKRWVEKLCTNVDLLKVTVQSISLSNCQSHIICLLVSLIILFVHSFLCLFFQSLVYLALSFIHLQFANNYCKCCLYLYFTVLTIITI